MRLRNFVIAVAALAIAVPGFAAAKGSPNDRATGGGQIFMSFGSGDDGPSTNEPVIGAGDTIAFTAQEDPRGGVKGQVQFIDRSGGTGQGQVKLHGTVTCLEVDGNTARIGGTATRTEFDDRPNTFQLLVIDNGEGASNLEGDQIAFQFIENPTCGQNDDEDDYQTTLARGNVQVYDAPDN